MFVFKGLLALQINYPLKIQKMFRTYFTAVVLITIALWLSPVSGQEYEPFKGKVMERMTKSFSDAVEYDLLYPTYKTKGRRIVNEINRYPVLPFDESKVIYKAPLQPSMNFATKEPSPLPDDDFLGLDDSGASIPPDVNGAAGPEHLMITLNTQIRIMDRQGNPISTISTGSFWHPMPGSGGVFDPKISYDHFENRWILIMPSSSDPASSRLMVAVSENHDPTGNWFLYSFVGDPQKTHWFDYPNYGFNHKWIVVSGNMFGGAGVYVALYVLNKQDLYNNATEINFDRFSIYNGFTLVPSVNYDEEEEDIFMVHNAGGNISGFGYLNLWRVTGPVNDPEVVNVGLTGVPDPWNNGSYANYGNFAPQLGSSEKINTVDARMENMILRHGKLWTTHHVYLPVNNPNRCAVQWFELSPLGEIYQWGRVDDPSGLMYYAFATIAVNAKEDVMVGYASFSEQQYASGSYSFRYADDPPNTMRESYQFIDGLAPYYKTFGAGRNRWGDYTATWVDPVDDLDFWTIQQYADLPSSQDRWGTWWAYINIHSEPKADFLTNIETVPVGSGVNFTDKSKFEPVTWHWIFEGGTPAVSYEQHPQNIVYNSAGLYDVTLIVTNDLGTDTLVKENFIDANTTILPEVIFTVSDTIPCMNNTVQLSDHSVYNPVSWQWSFSPDYVTFHDGTDEFSQNPVVTFDYPFTYSVALTATNNNGSASLTKEALIKAGGEPIPFIEDFESRSFMKNGWTIENPDGGKTWDMVQVGGTQPGNLAAYVNIKNYAGLSERDRLISPPMNFYGYKDVSLSFQYAYSQRFAQYTDSLIVYVSADCGDNWQRLLVLGEDGAGSFATAGPTTLDFIPASTGDWCGSDANPACLSLDLSEWSGQSNIKVMFETYNGFGNNILIDNVQVEGTISSVKPVAGSNAQITVFPNPSDGNISLLVEGLTGELKISILDITGRIVLQDVNSASGQERTIHYNLQDRKSGVYFISVENNGNRYVQKFLVR
jgi:PKD repeat protein